MNTSNKSRKNDFETILNTPLKSEAESHPQIVSLVLTESVASSLNIKAQHLQDIRENYDKSKICLFVGSKIFENKKKTVHASCSKFLINENLALFRLFKMQGSSTSVSEMDDLSVNSQEKQVEVQENSSLYLEQQLVYTRSLMAICSIAHEGNLEAKKDKNIYVNVTKTDLPISSSGWINMCRICHGSDSSEELIGPCRCKGSVALAHLSCLERWLRESCKSHCELCLHHYEIQRQPRYNLLKSIQVYLTTSGEHRTTLITDLISFSLYTPATVCSTYILMLIGDAASKTYDLTTYNNGHLIMFCAVAGIAIIDFTYSSWVLMRLQYHMASWRNWYRENCCLTLILPPRKRRRRCANPTSQHEYIVTD